MTNVAQLPTGGEIVPFTWVQAFRYYSALRERSLSGYELADNDPQYNEAYRKMLAALRNPLNGEICYFQAWAEKFLPKHLQVWSSR